MSQTPCMILDEDELERVATAAAAVPEWRKEGGSLVAARIFGDKEASSPRQFPTAFQTYRPERATGQTQQQQPQQRPFPFQMTRRVSATATAAASPPTSIVRRTESTSPEPRGSLFKTVRTVFYNSAKGEQSLPEPEKEILYAPCTPPFAAAVAPTLSETPPLLLDPSSSESSKNAESK